MNLMYLSVLTIFDFLYMEILKKQNLFHKAWKIKKQNYEKYHAIIKDTLVPGYNSASWEINLYHEA